MKKSSQSIKTKIFIYLLLFSTVLLIVFWLSQVVFLDSIYKAIRTNEVDSAVATVVDNIESDDLKSLLSSMATNQEIFVTIIDSDKNIIYTNNVSNFNKEYLHQNGLFDSLRSKEGIRGSGRPQEERNDRISIKRQENLTLENGKDITLLLDAVVSPVNATVKTLRIMLYFITIFMVVFSITLALLISRRVSKPIEKLNESTKLLATGEYNVTFNGTGYKEISELSDTLNYTAKELSKVESLRQELIANVSHDLRTPLTLISGYAEVMRDLPGENNSENAQIIIDETKRLTTLVNDMLDTSKLQSGIHELNATQFSLTSSLDKEINRVNELVRVQGYTIKFNFDQDVSIKADEIKISQAFYNLLTNAINYTGEDKKVFVKQIVNESEVRIEVTDSGEGISQENLPYIWDRYYKVSKNHKRAVTGSGLGLSIVKSIISMHHGHYGVTSSVGKGSTFWFSLPR